MDYLVRILDDKGSSIEFYECMEHDVDWLREDGQIEGKHFTLEKIEETA